ncbi:PE family protein, partial [Mycobacterium sp. THU-M116]
MSFVLAAPDALVSAASDLAGLGSTISTANAVAAPPTTGVLAAAADEVSTQIAALFSHHAVEYQQLSSQVSQFHQRFVQALTEAANAYASAETRAAQTLVNAVNTPAE